MSRRLPEYGRDEFPVWILSLTIIMLLLTAFIAGYWYSINSLTVNLESIKHSGRFIPLSEALTFEVGVKVENKGLLPVNVGNLTAKLYLENVELGILQYSKKFTVPAGSKINLNMTLKIFVRNIKASDLARIVSAMMRGRLTFRIEGNMNILFFPSNISVSFNSTKTVNM